MTLLYPWILFFAIPLFLLYKSDMLSQERYKARQKRLLYLSLAFILLALSRPVIQDGLSEQKFDASDFIIALDASYSMQADDVKPNRYTFAKEHITTILKQRNHDRFTLFSFTTNAMLISPPTTDTALSMLALDALEPRYILTKGTSLRALFKAVAKTSFKEKNLILFTDGGEESDLKGLVNIAKEAHIIPFIVAVGSKSGTTLTKDGKLLKDTNNNLVISRINPILKPLALESGGRYYELSDNHNISEEIIADLQAKKKTKESTVSVMNYTELFTIPLFIAIMLFFFSVTKFHQIYLFLPLLLFSQPTKASMLFDFHHLNSANEQFREGNFSQSAKAFGKLTPSVASYYNQAVAHYKAKEYKKAMQLFSQIQTPNPDIKEKIYYNMGNCAIKLKKYDRAKIYYQKALSLKADHDAKANLLLIYKLKLKEGVDISDMLPKNETKQKTGASKKENIKKDSQKSSSSRSKQNTSKKSAGSGSKGASKSSQSKTASQTKANYKIGYRAYELMNKGYTNETHPW